MIRGLEVIQEADSLTESVLSYHEKKIGELYKKESKGRETHGEIEFEKSFDEAKAAS